MTQFGSSIKTGIVALEHTDAFTFQLRCNLVRSESTCQDILLLNIYKDAGTHTNPILSSPAIKQLRTLV